MSETILSTSAGYAVGKFDFFFVPLLLNSMCSSRWDPKFLPSPENPSADPLRRNLFGLRHTHADAFIHSRTIHGILVEGLRRVQFGIPSCQAWFDRFRHRVRMDMGGNAGKPKYTLHVKSNLFHYSSNQVQLHTSLAFQDHGGTAPVPRSRFSYLLRYES